MVMLNSRGRHEAKLPHHYFGWTIVLCANGCEISHFGVSLSGFQGVADDPGVISDECHVLGRDGRFEDFKAAFDAGEQVRGFLFLVFFKFLGWWSLSRV